MGLKSWTEGIFGGSVNKFMPGFFGLQKQARIFFW